MEFAEFIHTPTADGVTLHRAGGAPQEGTLCVTAHHLILSSRKDHREELWLLHKAVDAVERRLQGPAGSLVLRCKDLSVLRLDIPAAQDCLNIANSVEQLSNIDNPAHYYPFYYRAAFTPLEDGWSLFQPDAEFARLKAVSDRWRLSLINRNFELCSSYPAQVIVPRSVDDETIFKAATFRQGSRFPVFSYYHKESEMCLLRSSQPLIGTSNRRCKEDERLLNAVLGIGKRGYILDTRAQATAVKVGGIEPEAHYPQWRRLHQAIERHHNLQDSLIKLTEACDDTTCSMGAWLSRLDASNWLGHVKDVLTAACVAAQCLDKEGASVLVHGAEGTDSTLQVTSLAQLLLDQDCRTVRGFEALVEREWLQAGHPFLDRCSKSAASVSRSRQEAPVFLLFLDCVWQIWQQFPCSFEFSEDFLALLFQHAYASQFGTFLGNNERERRRLKLSERTVSLWSYVNRPETLAQQLNPLYEPNPGILWPSVAAPSLTLWEGVYQRDMRHVAVAREIRQEAAMISEQDKALVLKATKLRKQLASLEKEALDAGLLPRHAPLNSHAP